MVFRTTTFAIALWAGCATTAGPKPQPVGSRGPHASEHLEAAQQQDQLARNEGRWPETRPDANGRVEQPVGVPWHLSWESRADHERMAALHRGVAAEIQAEYERECGTRSLADASTSPLRRYGISGSATADGVTIWMSAAAGPPEHLLADIRCHRAWMMLSPADMEECPLDLEGIHIEATGDASGVIVQITARDPQVITELHRRTARELEQASARGHVSASRAP